MKTAQPNITWQWDRDGTVVATSASYTVAEGDAEMSLEVTATYNDAHGTGKMVSATVMIAADVVGSYDTNGTPGIQSDELFDAIDDFFEGGIITIAELFELIDDFFADNG